MGSNSAGLAADLVALPLALIGTGVAQGMGRAVHPLYASNVRPAVEYVRARRLPGDALLLTGERFGDIAQPPYNGKHLKALCYWRAPAAPVYTTISSLNEVHERRMWVIMTFDPGNRGKASPDTDPPATGSVLARLSGHRGAEGSLPQRARRGGISLRTNCMPN